MIIQIFFIVSIFGLLIGNSEVFGQEHNSEINIRITPDKVKYGESVLFQYSLSSYDKPDEELYAFNVVNPESVEIDSKLWFARQDSEYKFETYHPTYNIVNVGTYSLNFEKAVGMERTGEIVKTVFFEITTNPPPVTQYERGVNFDLIRCNTDLKLIFKIDISPACVKLESIPKLIERGWAKDESKNDSHILKYSPVVIKGTGVIVQENLLLLEDLQQLEKRKLEWDILIKDPNLSETERNEIYDEQNLIILHAERAFNEKVSWDLVKVLWEKSNLFSEKFGSHDREQFPIPTFSGVTFGFDAYSLDEEYVGKVTGIKVGIVKEKFTREILERTDKMLREIIGDEIDIVYYKSGYLSFGSS